MTTTPAPDAGHSEAELLADPRVKPSAYIVYPSCYDEMGNSDRDYWCLSVVEGHAWGWSIRRGMGGYGGPAMNRHGKWIFESRGSGRNKPRRWSLGEALSIALCHVDTHVLNGATAADCARRFPVDPSDARR